jgi:hypothetical protein
MVSTLKSFLLAVFALAGCANVDHMVEYCSPQRLDAPDRMQIDLRERRVIGPDSHSKLVSFRRGDVVWIEHPFPLLVFRDGDQNQGLMGDHLASDYVFSVKSLESAQYDWWLIEARPRATEQNGHPTTLTSTVLYSSTSGVLALNISPQLGGTDFSSNYVPCARRALTFQDLVEGAHELE